MSEEKTCRVEFEKELACDECGRFGAFAFDGKNLCTDCYESHGSCCPEFDREDNTARAPERSHERETR